MFGLFQKSKNLKTVDASQIRHKLYEQNTGQKSPSIQKKSYHQFVQKSQLQQKSLEKKIDLLLKETQWLKKQLLIHNIQLIRSYPLFLFVRNLTSLFANKIFICLLLVLNIFLGSQIIFYQHKYINSPSPYGYAQLPNVVTLPFTISIGQYLSLDDALVAQKQLKRIGFESQVFLIKNTFYSLYIGYYSTPSQAHITLKQLHKHTNLKGAHIAKRF